MPFDERYRRQVQLLMRILPLIAAEEQFALKGGTAINLFYRNMPRLSVDLDLTYVPVAPRPESLNAIDAALRRIKEHAHDALDNAHIAEGRLRPEGIVTKLSIREGGAETKIEVTPVLRGCIEEPQTCAVSEAVESEFGFAETRALTLRDVFGGKIVAALDRQHPRDLFDIKGLLENEGIDDGLRRSFIVYLLSHDRPMHEVLSSPQKDIRQEFERNFLGMTAEAAELDDLIAARAALVDAVVGQMPKEHRDFLISFERGTPTWNVLGIPAVSELPAVRWRQQNLDKLAPEQRATLVENLERVLSG